MRDITLWVFAWTLGVAASPSVAQVAVRVPEIPPTPVLVDGQLSAGEWEDAAVVPVADGLRLLFRQAAGHVFIAVDVPGRVSRPVDLYLQAEGGLRVQLHASAQTGERDLPPAGWAPGEPAFCPGNPVGWVASVARVDAGRPEDLPYSARTHPADGVELQLLRSRFPGRRWRLAVYVGGFTGSEGDWLWPAGATGDPGSWAVLELD